MGLGNGWVNEIEEQERGREEGKDSELERRKRGVDKGREWRD